VITTCPQTQKGNEQEIRVPKKKGKHTTAFRGHDCCGNNTTLAPFYLAPFFLN